LTVRRPAYLGQVCKWRGCEGVVMVTVGALGVTVRLTVAIA
jgi:hypothetical protein